MHRKSLFESLVAYENLCRTYFQGFEGEEERLALLRGFAAAHSNCFDRENLEGHFTASAFILSPDLKKVLLTFHAKIQKWMQLGGHADGHPLLHEVALKEAQEESGSQHLSFLDTLSSIPFDLDVHTIQAHKGVPAHLHYDLRYLLVCHKEESISISEESLDLRWIPLDQVREYTEESSVERQVKKALIFRGVSKYFTSRSLC